MIVEKHVAAGSCPGAPKLDPRVRRTRKLLEEALRALLAEKPFGKISVGDIAERATVNRATFYAHFEDKGHLASTMLRGDLESALLARLQPGTRLSAESLGVVAEAVFEFMGRIHGACPRGADEFAPVLAATLQDAIEGFLRTWLDHDPDGVRVFRGATKDVIATALAWSLYGAAFRWSQLRQRPPAARSAREVIQLFVR
jgi:AcrR family transcriptional regulator